MNNIFVGIGRRLREFRKSQGLTQAQLAELLDVSCNFYGDIERGKCKISLEKIIFLYEKFSLDPTYLLTGDKSSQVTFYDLINDCPKEKIFDMEQIVRYASNLYRKK